MPSRPIRARGILRKVDLTWQLELDSGHPSFEDGMLTEIVLWDSREAGSKSEVEEIARIQQLDPTIVAHMLAAEGALSNSGFGARVAST